MLFIAWLFEIGYLLQHAATLSQIMRIQQKRKTELVSLETNILFLIGALSRLVWMWDSLLKGFFLAYIEIVLALASLIYIIYLFEKNKLNDMFSDQVKLPTYIRLQVLIPVILLLSFCFHPGPKGPYYLSLQMMVSLSIFSESIGLIPQLYIIKKERDTGNLSQFYVVFLAFARLFRLCFWLKMWMDGSQYLPLIIADLVHSILLFDFVYNVFKNWNKVVLPTFGETIDKPKKMY